MLPILAAALCEVHTECELRERYTNVHAYICTYIHKLVEGRKCGGQWTVKYIVEGRNARISVKLLLFRQIFAFHCFRRLAQPLCSGNCLWYWAQLICLRFFICFLAKVVGWPGCCSSLHFNLSVSAIKNNADYIPLLNAT